MLPDNDWKPEVPQDAVSDRHLEWFYRSLVSCYVLAALAFVFWIFDIDSAAFLFTILACASFMCVIILIFYLDHVIVKEGFDRFKKSLKGP